MGHPLSGKKAIMDYSGFGKKALGECIDQASFPHFFVGGRMMSHTDLIDKWFFELAVRRVSIGAEGEVEKDEP